MQPVAAAQQPEHSSILFQFQSCFLHRGRLQPTNTSGFPLVPVDARGEKEVTAVLYSENRQKFSGALEALALFWSSPILPGHCLEHAAVLQNKIVLSTWLNKDVWGNCDDGLRDAQDFSFKLLQSYGRNVNNCIVFHHILYSKILSTTFLSFFTADLQHAAFVSTCVCGALKSWRKMNQVAKRCLERVSSPLARVVLLSSEVLPSFPVLDSILPCCSPSVAVYHSHLCVLRKKSLKQSNNHSCFLFVLKPWFFQIMFLVLLFQLSAQKGKRKS